MSEKLTVGFTETKEALTFAFAIVQGVKTARENDGKFTVGDVPGFFPALFQIVPAVDNLSEIPLEFKMATQEEADELKQWVKDNFAIEDDKVETFIEDGFAIVLDIWMLINRYVLNTGATAEDKEAIQESFQEAVADDTAEPTVSEVKPEEEGNDSAETKE